MIQRKGFVYKFISDNKTVGITRKKQLLFECKIQFTINLFKL